MKIGIGILNLSKKINTISMIRTAEHFGVKRVFVIGSKLRETEKSCMSCHRNMLIKYFRTEEAFINHIKRLNYKLILIEKTKGSKNISSYDFPEDCVLMSGHENMGFSKYLLSNAYSIIHISNVGLVNCMNTAAAFSIGIYKYFEQKVLQ